MPRDACNRRKRRFQGFVRGLGGFAVQRLLQVVDLLGAQDAFAQQAHLHARQRIAHGVGFALGGRAVQLVVVGKRMRIGPDAMPVHKCRPEARPAMLRRGLECPQAGFGIGAVDLGKMEVGEIGHQPRDVAARGVHLHRHADGIAVVLDA